MERKIAHPKFRFYTNQARPDGNWTDDGRHLSWQLEMLLEQWIKDHGSYNYMELLGLMHYAVGNAWTKLAVSRKFCSHADVPDDDDYCEKCGARLE